MAMTLVTAAAIEPVTLAEAKDQLRVDITDDDVLIAGLIVVAREFAEAITRRALITQTWDYIMDAFPAGDRLALPLAPLQSVTSITYVDDEDASDTVSSADYQVDTDSEPGRIVLKSTATWPSVTLRAANGVTVRFVAGYGDDVEDVPQKIRQAMLLMVGHWYENREDTVGVGNVQRIPMGAEWLLWPERVLRF
jgi:uncharacterized phiE125 gp8 family phage protein